MVLEIEINEVKSKDIAQMFGCSKRTAERRIALLRVAYNLPKNAIVTLDRFCSYYCIDAKDIHIKMTR